MANILGTDQEIKVEHLEKRPTIDFYASADYFRLRQGQNIVDEFYSLEFQRHIKVLAMALHLHEPYVGRRLIGAWNNYQVYANFQGLEEAKILVDALVYDDGSNLKEINLQYIPKFLRQAEVIRYIKKRGSSVLE